MLRLQAVLLLVLLGFSWPALAMIPTQPSAASKGNPDYMKADALVKQEKYAEAIPLLEKVLLVDNKNADAHSLLGLSMRKTGKLKESLDQYLTAIKLDPEHKAANEYLGELYLTMDDLPRAEERLAVLDKLCTLGCEAYDDLKEAIAAYKKKKGLSG
ncbi:MAG: tetratricopeptide repeat protein [Proteobacteria bacterium]|nr:tetratricopeptide repeat protein [Pseudomonadota bacterium]MBI3497050.1 tetratricopeptide repeat protein [Pseudomonadota bacterium]